MAKRNKPIIKHRKSGTQHRERWNAGRVEFNKETHRFCEPCWAPYDARAFKYCPHCTTVDGNITNR